MSIYRHQATPTTCGPAAMGMALEALLGKRWSEGVLAAAMATDAQGTRPRAMVALARRRGLQASQHEGQHLSALTPARRGALDIVCYRMPVQEIGHYAVVVAADAERVVLADPWFGPGFTLSTAEFAQRWRCVEGLEGDSDRWSLRLRRETAPNGAADPTAAGPRAPGQDPMVSREAIIPHGTRRPSMARSDCRNCGHAHFNQGAGPCRDCFCTSFRGYARVPRSARSAMPPGSHLKSILAARGMRTPAETDWGW